MELSVLIPSKNEKYLHRTVRDLYTHAETDIEVLYREDCGIGQRKLTNELCMEAKGKYVMKTDAHCSFGQGWDTKLLMEIDDTTILAPTLMPLDGERWTINGKKQMKQFAFGPDFVMQHVGGEAGDTMCLQGSCWMVSTENYWKWNLGDETMPAWGGQAVELGIKAFLNGGRCRTTTKTFYGHVFRHTNEEFPYNRGESPGKQATEKLIKCYKNKSLVPLIEKFGYPAGWSPQLVADLT